MPSFFKHATATASPTAARGTSRGAQIHTSMNLLSTKEVARMTGLSTSWFEKARVHKRGPKYIKIGNGKVLYRLAEIERWLMTQEQAPRGQGDE